MQISCTGIATPASLSMAWGWLKSSSIDPKKNYKDPRQFTQMQALSNNTRKSKIINFIFFSSSNGSIFKTSQSTEGWAPPQKHDVYNIVTHSEMNANYYFHDFETLFCNFKVTRHYLNLHSMHNTIHLPHYNLSGGHILICIPMHLIAQWLRNSNKSDIFTHLHYYFAKNKKINDLSLTISHSFLYSFTNIKHKNLFSLSLALNHVTNSHISDFDNISKFFLNSLYFCFYSAVYIHQNFQATRQHRIFL